MLKAIILGGASAIVMSGAAMAQSRPAMAPVFTWSGFYVGVTAGAALTDSGQTVGSPVAAGLGAGSAVYVAGNSTATTGTTKGANVFLGGGQVGYNMQLGGFVAGLEADISTSSRARDLRSINQPVPGFAAFPIVGTAQTQSSYNYIGTVRARLGYLLMDNLLVYATGGLAYAERRNSTQFSLDIFAPAVPAYAGRVAGNSTRTGFVAGGGLEYALDQNWSVKGEALYYDMGTSRGRGTLQSNSTATNSFFTINNLASSTPDRGVIARVGLNYKFTSF